jgi:hypothetical protein
MSDFNQGDRKDNMKLTGYFVQDRGPRDDTLAKEFWRVEAESADKKLVLEQYRLYAEMADRVSARRALANTFFLTLNTAIFTLLGIFWSEPPEASPWLGLFPLAALEVQCFVWFAIIRSYRQLNGAKWAVVGEFETGLPTSPWAAEWVALAKGKDPSVYWPLTHVERWVPAMFAVAYLGGFVALVVTA